jgi:hypothetical protein
MMASQVMGPSVGKIVHKVMIIMVHIVVNHLLMVEVPAMVGFSMTQWQIVKEIKALVIVNGGVLLHIQNVQMDFMRSVAVFGEFFFC